MAPGDSLRTLTALALQKCLQRMGRGNPGDWRLTAVEAQPGTLAGALAPYEGIHTAASYMVMDALPFAGAMLVNPADIEAISRSFTGHSFPRGARITPAEEVMLTELGNIFINVLVNVLLNALKSSALPALPAFAAGDAQALGAAIAAPKGPCRLIEARMELRGSGPASEVHLFGLIPESLAARLD